MDRLTSAQLVLRCRCGTPSAFAVACGLAADRLAVTTGECDAAVAEYQREWDAAGVRHAPQGAAGDPPQRERGPA